MAIVHGYCTLDDLKSSWVLNTTATTWSTSTSSDDFLSNIITACSRKIDGETGRYFWESTADEVRYFTAKDANHLFVDDFVSITSIITDELSGARTYPFTWSTTDYDLVPYDAATKAEPEPYRWIDTSPQGLYAFPVKVPRGVKITGKFGWPEVPQRINQACLLWSARIFMRFSSVLGVSSASPFGQQVLRVPIDPDIADLIDCYKMPAV